MFNKFSKFTEPQVATVWGTVCNWSLSWVR